jgi:hypothetical protein
LTCLCRNDAQMATVLCRSLIMGLVAALQNRRIWIFNPSSDTRYKQFHFSDSTMKMGPQMLIENCFIVVSAFFKGMALNTRQNNHEADPHYLVTFKLTSQIM